MTAFEVSKMLLAEFDEQHRNTSNPSGRDIIELLDDHLGYDTEDEEYDGSDCRTCQYDEDSDDAYHACSGPFALRMRHHENSELDWFECPHRHSYPRWLLGRVRRTSKPRGVSRYIERNGDEPGFYFRELRRK